MKKVVKSSKKTSRSTRSSESKEPMYVFRLVDFNIYDGSDEPNENSSDEEEEEEESDKSYKKVYDKKCMIQLFGVDEKGQSYSVSIPNFKPFFYILVNETWHGNIELKNKFVHHIKTVIGAYWAPSIMSCDFVKRKKLYGFDGGKTYDFLCLTFHNIAGFNKVKNLWYSKYNPKLGGARLLPDGYKFLDSHTYLYESNIPPLLRFFHIKDISPSGWISINNAVEIKSQQFKNTTCNYELIVQDYKTDITPLNDKETLVPYKICSFDIEASSSHGDFPIPVKTYKKLSTNILDCIPEDTFKTKEELWDFIHNLVLYAFGIQKDSKYTIDIVYPKQHIKISKKLIEDKLKIIKEEPYTQETYKKIQKDTETIESMFERLHENIENDSSEDIIQYDNSYTKLNIQQQNNVPTIMDILFDKTLFREQKLKYLTTIFNKYLPELEGDKVTFIGSTFIRYGEKTPYLNHGIVLNSCSPIHSLNNTEIESYNTEKEVLLAWQKMIQRENPDIIIGYNIFGFDYEFMFQRSKETSCVEEFLKLSRNKGELCASQELDPITKKWNGNIKIEESSIQIASGTHELKFIKMNGRLQIDLYNFFRREENLTSYKLDYVAGYFIGDYVKNVTFETDTKTVIKTTNLTGLVAGSYIHFEEIGHSIDYYEGGKKFQVIEVNEEEKTFTIQEPVKFTKKTKWGLAKDDVTPKDIFEMTNGTADDRAIIMKYCFQDCNLVQNLLNKRDVLTGFIEMAKICSVPINFLVMRGQGIKLTSFIAKKCKEKGVLMPVIDKGASDEGYEGAIVLEPKCNLYLDNPVACVDYASLYPSSMISENLSHDTKVWTKEYDLAGNLIQETGEKHPKTGKFIYDNLPGLEYVDVTYDTYTYVRKNPNAAAEKVLSGKKICRFEQTNKGIMPSILEELLQARKKTRKLIPQQTDEFMKNVLDKRQLGYKLTANSLYGQCGAKTSTFYEKDVAASTTSTGRLLLTYAKRVIEECYGDSICNTEKFGPVCTKAEYIYGDSVASYTPVTVRVNGLTEICTIEDLANKYGEPWRTCKEIGKEEKEVSEILSNTFTVESWTEQGWTPIYRVIRHKLASHKKMVRVLTHTGLVDVTDDHSLITANGFEISPKDCVVGTELLHNKVVYVNQNVRENKFTIDEAKIMGFFFGDGSCGEYNCPSGKKNSWALNNASQHILNKYLELCKKVYSNYEWVILDTLESSGVYKICPKSSDYGSIASFVKRYRSMMYFNKSKIIPNEILISNVEIQEAFFEGLYDADGDKDNNGYTRIDQKSQISASHIFQLASNIGYSVSINNRKDKMDILRLTMTKNKQRKNPNAIKKIEEIKYEGYVYDLTTENHHFAAGVGNMIVHNTDSVFFTFNLEDPKTGQPIRGKDALEITIELAQEAGHLASKFLKAPHDLEYEKTFMPFCLLSKKRYVGMLYETNVNECKRKEMGIVLKRRDNAPIVKDVYGGIIDILMKKQNIEEAVQFLKTSLDNMVNGNCPMDKLVITKSLRSGYKNPKAIAHKVLADRMTERDPGNKPSPGDRIPFVYIENNNLNALQGDKIETPTFIIQNNKKIDYGFYITNQIMKPVQQVFALVLKDIYMMMNLKGKYRTFEINCKKLSKEWKDNPSKLSDKLDDLKNKEVKSLLFDKYLREVENSKNKCNTMTKYFLKR